jgi:hypothetical protein
VATGLVIGIFSETDAKALEDALKAQQIDVSKVKVFASDGAESKSSPMRFVNVVHSETLSPEMTEGTGVMQDFGTAVPGLGDRAERSGPIYSFEEGDEGKHYLADYPVPDDEVENFDDAITDGRAVVLYPDAGADAPKIAAAFEAAGLHNVRSY